mmetsp:Transcript_34316/g.77830  ORF Transcript_34316/g.77830 Transcript_34316/m.77830 type:complete len:207 (+) Transcript_34316:186-806(+)
MCLSACCAATGVLCVVRCKLCVAMCVVAGVHGKGCAERWCNMGGMDDVGAHSIRRHWVSTSCVQLGSQPRVAYDNTQPNTSPHQINRFECHPKHERVGKPLLNPACSEKCSTACSSVCVKYGRELTSSAAQRSFHSSLVHRSNRFSLDMSFFDEYLAVGCVMLSARRYGAMALPSARSIANGNSLSSSVVVLPSLYAKEMVSPPLP